MIGVRQAGDAALLLDIAPSGDHDSGGNEPARFAAVVRAAALPGVIDVVPAAVTVLVTVEPGGDLAALATRLRQLAAAPPPPVPAASSAELVFDTVYDGPDLADVATLTGLTVAQVIARHSAASYRVGWLGFSPGFGYLTGLDPALAAVPRLGTPRVTVPAGSVAIAGGLAAVYPNASPGGWRLLGRTARMVWDPGRDPPSALSPGQHVRFRPVEQLAASTPAGDAGQIAPPADRWVEVLEPGPLTTVQDLGRPGLAHLGVPRSGAADTESLRRANQLAGNPDDAAGLEATLGRIALRFETDAVVAVTGAPVPLTLAGTAAPQETALHVRSGSVLRLGSPSSGLRSYLAIDGGIGVPAVLGSRSTDQRSGLGPPRLRAGQRLPVNRTRSHISRPVSALPRAVETDPVVLRVVAGPRDDWFSRTAMDALSGGSYQVTPASDRTGLRLAGPLLRRSPDTAGELPSEGVATGSLQVTHDGQPILLLADHPTTGGYPVIAVVVSADLGLAAQLRPGQQLRFAMSRSQLASSR